MRPVIRQTSAEKIFRYFFDEEWKKYEAIVLGIRNQNNKINFFDDENYTWNKKRNSFKTFNWNADPSKYRVAGEGASILRTGVHLYTISYHHIGNNAKRYVGLRPKTSGEKLPVWRMDANGRLELSYGTAINHHAGGDRTTGSRGCQTAPPKQYAEYITFLGDAFDVKIPLGVQKKAEKRFMNGIGEIPYILITQEQFNYIIVLDESEFDSPADIEYQRRNFVNVPKVKRVKPVVAEAENPENIIAAIEAAENDEESELDFIKDSAAAFQNSLPEDSSTDGNRIQNPSASPAAVNSEIAFNNAANEPPPDDFNLGNPLEGFGEKIGGFIEEQTGKVEGALSRSQESVTRTIETADGKLEKTVSEVKDTFDPKNIPAFIPRFGKQWLLGLIPGGGLLSTIIAKFASMPDWLVFTLGFFTGVTTVLFFQLIIKHREKVLDFITTCYNTTANPAMHNLIPTNAVGFVGQRGDTVKEKLKENPTVARLSAQFRSLPKSERQKFITENFNS